MSVVFKSHFAKQLEEFLSQKRALGYSYSNLADFRIFDHMCEAQFPTETELTPEICNTWATRRKNETVQTVNRRLPFIREFARYLIRSGEKAYILPPGTVKGAKRYIPHIYSHAELTEIWKAADNIKSSKQNPIQHIILPVILRLLFCSGIRPSEAFKLTMQDVNLKSGKLFIAKSKGNRDRIVMLRGGILNICHKFNDEMNTLFPDRVFFFARSITEPYGHRWLNYIYRELLRSLQIENRYGLPPRLYDLRHSFATHRLYQWLKDGKDLHTVMPYLSAYMGHSKIRDTYYYIHLVPGMYEEMSGFQYESPEDIFPKVVSLDE